MKNNKDFIYKLFKYHSANALMFDTQTLPMNDYDIDMILKAMYVALDFHKDDSNVWDKSQVETLEKIIKEFEAIRGK